MAHHNAEFWHARVFEFHPNGCGACHDRRLRGWNAAPTQQSARGVVVGVVIGCIGGAAVGLRGGQNKRRTVSKVMPLKSEKTRATGTHHIRRSFAAAVAAECVPTMAIAKAEQ